MNGFDNDFSESVCQPVLVAERCINEIKVWREAVSDVEGAVESCISEVFCWTPRKQILKGIEQCVARWSDGKRSGDTNLAATDV